ncbi:O-antigen ligase family protein [Rubinisphaera sp. JC750]|uniref:O-antigen ligase family protein n=1 Tax=Rubinisphaera sp. JC750 TaxID=2898658 RepID=UPI001F3D1488|nr:O-antigen ligase family protein [Rubinisphaera sp. JC750]
MKVSTSHSAFACFLAANATIYVRPWEIFPALNGLPIYLGLIVAAGLLAYQSIQLHLRPLSLLAQPITLCVLGVCAGVAVSHLTNGYLGGMVSGTVMMAKTVAYYLVLVATVNTPQRLRVFMISLAICGVVSIGIAVADYHNVVPIESLTHIKERTGYSPTGVDQFLIRLCGLGMFHDPNDMSLLIITTGILCTAQLFDRQWGQARIFWVLPYPLLLLALLDTHSRGGLIAGGAGAMAFLSMRYGRSFAIAALGLGVLAAPLALGRMANIDLSSGTGQQRIRLWSEGFTAIQSPRLLFGIGQGMYEDLANYVAHNSYVHAFVELGLFGGTFFVGCLFFAGYGLYRLKADSEAVYEPKLQYYQPFMAAILATWCAGMLSLSRCYPPPTYTIIGMMAAYLNITGAYLEPARPVLWLDRGLRRRWLCGSGLVFVAMFAATRLLARF